uniref:Uncharacterized protein n=1 Tax=viral metagenome TaxID=1070528 RepID=A0A6H1Z8T4_9ZZZZ
MDQEAPEKIRVHGVEVYTLRGAARVLGVAPGTVGMWLSRGRLRRVPTMLGRTTIAADSVDALALARAAHPPRKGRPPKAVP